MSIKQPRILCLAVAGLALGLVNAELRGEEASVPWKIGKHRVTFYVKHPFKRVAGDASSIIASGLDIRKVEGIFVLGGPVQIDTAVAGLRTGNTNRDAHMLEVLGYPQYKQVRVVLLRSRARDAGHYHLEGRITVKGVERPFAGTAAITEQKGGVVDVRGEFVIKLSEFGVERPALLFYRIEDAVRITYTLTCERSR